MSSTYGITGLDHTYLCPILRAAYVGYLYLQNHGGTLHVWVSDLAFSQLLSAPLTE